MKQNIIRAFLLGLSIILPLISISAKEISKNFTQDLDDVEILYKDGTNERGAIEDLVANWGQRSGKLWSLEKVMGIHGKTFVLTDPSGKEKTITSDSVKSIYIYEDEGIKEIRRLNLKTVNVKGEIVDLDKNVWLPVTVNDSRVSILSFNKYVSYSSPYKSKKKVSIDKATYAGTYVYLQRVEEDFAIIPVDLNRINLLNMASTGDKYKIALKETFRDCDKTVALIDKDWGVSNKEGLKRYKALKKETNQKIKKLPKKERKSAWDAFYTAYTMRLYLPILEQYNKECPTDK
jgi:hypothetical protein